MALFLGFDFYGNVGAPQLTEFATDAIFSPDNTDLFPVIQGKNLFGAELDANPAPLAPVQINVVFF
jgi:hypothetical protein